MDLFETIWKDPVWSKVIAAAIIPVLSLFKKKFDFVYFLFLKYLYQEDKTTKKITKISSVRLI